MANLYGLEGHGQVAEWSNAPVLKFHAWIRRFTLEPLIYAGYEPRIARCSRIVRRSALAGNPAQLNGPSDERTKRAGKRCHANRPSQRNGVRYE